MGAHAPTAPAWARAAGLLRPVLALVVGVPVLLLVQRGVRGTGLEVLLIYIAINIVLAVSLNIVNGFTGQFSLGHAGFMAVGGYTAAKITMVLASRPIAGLPLGLSSQLVFLVALAAGMLTAGAAGWLVGIPSLRLRGDYLAIVTLGFGEIIVTLIKNLEFFDYAIGLQDLRKLTTVPWAGAGALLTVVVARRLAVSTQGRALFAIREDEVAAEAMGVDTTGYKVRAFVISSAFAGLGGGLLVHQLQQATPGSFTFATSIAVLVLIVLGGLGSITGSVVAATVMTLLQQWLKKYAVVAQYEQVIYSVLLIVLMLVRPQGLFGTRELWDLPIFRRLPWTRIGVKAAATGGSPPTEVRDDEVGGAP